MKLLVTITLLVGLTRSLIVKDNVVFYKRNDVSTMHAKWMVTFVLDLYLHSQFIELNKEDIKNAAVFAETAAAYFKPKGEKEICDTFSIEQLLDQLQFSHFLITQNTM